MYCWKCGTPNNDSASECVSCRTPMAGPEAPSQPPLAVSNYLVPAILVTVLCCMPLGIPAIVFAAQVNGKIQAGDAEGAVSASGKAKLFCWLAFGLGLLVQLLYFAFIILSAVMG